jgi:hypothetical protein
MRREFRFLDTVPLRLSFAFELVGVLARRSGGHGMLMTPTLFFDDQLE